MINEKHDEILEAVWKSGEQGEFTDDSIRANCTVAFTDDDLNELVRKGYITYDGGRILFTAEGEKEVILIEAFSPPRIDYTSVAK